jgi:hypothetical protein
MIVKIGEQCNHSKTLARKMQDHMDAAKIAFVSRRFFTHPEPNFARFIHFCHLKFATSSTDPGSISQMDNAGVGYVYATGKIGGTLDWRNWPDLGLVPYCL